MLLILDENSGVCKAKKSSGTPKIKQSGRCETRSVVSVLDIRSPRHGSELLFGLSLSPSQRQ